MNMAGNNRSWWNPVSEV